MTTLKKIYTITLTIKDDEDEFLEDLNGKSGSDKIIADAVAALAADRFIKPTCSVSVYLSAERAKKSKEILDGALGICAKQMRGSYIAGEG